MDPKPQPGNSGFAWISGHPRIVIGFILIVCLAPFVDKAVHVDDPLFLWTGQWIQQHPADFFGFKVNWMVSAVPMSVANLNPPLMSYFLAGVAGLFGWSEIALHLAGLFVAFMAALGIYALAKLWCDRPLLATVAAIFTPVFLVSSTTLMCDMLTLAFWTWALVGWERALENKSNRWQFAGAGLLAGLAVLTKFSAVVLLPLLPVLALLRTRKWGAWLPGLAVPLLMVAGYEWLTARRYGSGGLSGAVSFVQMASVITGDWPAKGIIGLAFAGGSLLPLLLFAPWLWRQRTLLLLGGAAIFGALAGMLWLGDFQNVQEIPGSLNQWIIVLQLALMTAAGLHLLLLTGAEAWQSRDTISVILAFWILSGLLFAIGLNWTVSARSFLPIVPAVAILLVRRLRTAPGVFRSAAGFLWPLAPALAVAWSVAVADYRVANSARTAAGQIAAKYKSAGHTLWFEGHWGFQYYMEKLGGQPVDIECSTLQPGDVVVVPFNNYRPMPLPANSVGWLEVFYQRPGSWINLSIGTESEAGGFYSSIICPVPFGVGGIPPHAYAVVKVLSRVQYDSRPFNLPEVSAGAVPLFTNVSCSVGEEFVFPSTTPEAAGQIQLARQGELGGDLEAAIQHYRQALAMDSNNPVALNNLAWILATAGQPGLRNGPEAVQLSARAVELTESRLPVFIGTLAAACAATGQFPKAVETAMAAHRLAVITDQPEVAAVNLKLSGRYAAGKTADAPGSP